MPSERFQRNQKLVINCLGTTGYAVYVPPDPDPLRLPASAWLALDALADRQLTQSQLQEHLKKIPEDHESFEQYLKWLIGKRILLHVGIPRTNFDDQPSQLLNPRLKQKERPLDDSIDIEESNGIYLFSLNPRWPTKAQKALLRLLRLQIWLVAPMLVIVLTHIFFFLLAPAPNALYLLGVSNQASSTIDVLGRTLIGLLTVNLLSTALNWLTQSVTGLGDGIVAMRFLFGFIPRLGVNSYKGPAFEAKQWSLESDNALLCVAQPLLTRLGLAAFLIILQATGRLHNGLAGGWLYSVTSLILDISLFTGLLLALPFRKSPGYRLMILLTELPPNTLGQSVRHLYSVLQALIRYVLDRDRSARMALKSSVTSWRDFGLLGFAIIFFTLIIIKALVILFVAIPRLASGLPDLLGEASQFVFAVALLALFTRFTANSILTKFSKILKRRNSVNSNEPSDSDLLIAMNDSTSSNQASLLRNNGGALVVFTAIVILLLPINRTVTGSVVVSTERDLTVRAPADVRITRILQRGPSSQVISAGTPLIQLQSQQLESDLNETIVNLEQLKSELSTLKEQTKSDKDVMRELLESLKISHQAEQLLEDQLKTTQSLIKEGAYSQKMKEDIQLRSYDAQENEKAKIQQILALKAEIEINQLKILSRQKSIYQSQQLEQSLLLEKQKLKVDMPFDGLITSSTSGLMWSFVSKGESLLDLKEGSLNVVNVLIPDHDRALVRVGQKADVRLYANPSGELPAVIKSIRPTSELIDEKSFFQVSLRLVKPLSPQLLQSSGAARINTGKTNLFMAIVATTGRFINVDVWSWGP